MSVNILKQDITTVTNGVIVHGVNCSGYAMNSGVAKTIRNKWPVVFEVYVNSQKGITAIGNIVPIEVEPNLWVINGYTQLDFGYDCKIYASRQAVLRVMEQSVLFSKEKKLKLFAPKIGCGLGGLDWKDVLEDMNRLSLLYDYDITICEYKNE